MQRPAAGIVIRRLRPKRAGQWGFRYRDPKATTSDLLMGLGLYVWC